MKRYFENYLRSKNISYESKGDSYDLYWTERSLFHDYTVGWQARDDSDEGKVILDFTMQEPVDMERFREIYEGLVYGEVKLSFRERNNGRGCPCLSAKVGLEDEDCFQACADATILAILDIACSSWEEYVKGSPEEETVRFSSHYGNGQRLLFIDKYVVSISTLTHKFILYSTASGLMDEMDATPLLQRPGGEDSALESVGLLGAEEDEDFAKWIDPDEQGGGFSEVAGMDILKKKVGDSVIWPLTHKETAARYRVNTPGGMILYGPPGCGKSYFAEKFAKECGLPYRLVKPSELGSPFVHASQNMISRLFDEAEKKSPCVICMDEIDAMIPVRQMGNNSCRNDEVNEFLTQLNNCGKRGIFVIGTTNMKELIDPAALRKGRLDYQIEIPAPDLAQRKAMFDYELKGRPVFLDVDATSLAEKTEGCSCSDISYIVNEAALQAAIGEEEITQGLLLEQIRKITPSLRNNTVRRVGFTASAVQQKQMMTLAL